MNKIPRPEYPRPELIREKWINLNGTWDFEIDQSMTGRERGFAETDSLSQKIVVPFCPESKLSGIEYKDFMNCVWYKRNFTLPDEWRKDTRRTILHIGACDYASEVWINGVSAGTHIGGYVPVILDITRLLREGDNCITVCAEDDRRARTQPAGKQSFSYASQGCDYTRTTGIWQTVWLENVPGTYIQRIKTTPDVDNGLIEIEVFCAGAAGKKVYAEASYQGKAMGSAMGTVKCRSAHLSISLSELHLWEPGCGRLYDLQLTLGEDKVISYFGMRDIAYIDNKYYINGKPTFMRFALDQGYYPDGIYTAKDEAELAADIQLGKAMGFNGARLHQKVCEPRLLYHCDKEGYMVWGEFPDWGMNLTDVRSWQGILPEWMSVLERDYNHPAIITWCPMNETPHDQFYYLVETLMRMTRAYDRTRPVVDCSGWCHESDLSDIYDNHDYNQNPEEFKATYERLLTDDPAQLYSPRCPYLNANMSFMSEYGGAAWPPIENKKDAAWGYGAAPQTETEFIDRYRALTEAMLFNPHITGFCYTQLYDVEQEMNGLYYYSREPKFDPAEFKKINTQTAAMEKQG